jgi:hypothetical protein
MRLRSHAIPVLLFVCLSAPANAVTLNVTDGQLIGASNVDVGGDLYDVVFTDGSCITLFSGCDSNSDFLFTTEAAALAVAASLDQQVFLDGPQGDFDTVPGLTSDCGYSAVCEVYVPYMTNGTTVRVTRVENRSPPGPDEVEGGRLLLTVSNDLSQESENYAYTYAVLTAVPEPSTGLLVAIGLAGLGAGQRRRH